MRKLEEGYNQSQRQWVDDMINACHVSPVTWPLSTAASNYHRIMRNKRESDRIT